MLTSYNGKTIYYDAIGNPTNWRNFVGLVWNGRQLTYATTDGLDYGISYRYNESGIRTAKTAYLPNGITTTSYTLDGANILKEVRTGAQTATMYFYYDTNGSVTGFSLNGTNYFYGKNIQGDIKYIYNVNGAFIAEYCYDAWGNLISILDANGNVLTSGNNYTVATTNPFRYRSYYYDTESGFYYLNSRYYDPQVGRFINADGIVGANGDLVGYNLFAYCSNNPVNNIDPTGEFLISALITSVIVGAIIGVVGKYVEDVAYNTMLGKTGLDRWAPTSSWQDYTSSGIASGVMGGINYLAPGTGMLKSTADSLLKPTIKQTLEIISGDRDNIDFVELGRDATIRFGTSFLKSPGEYTSNPDINKIIGNLPSNLARASIKYVRKEVIPSFQTKNNYIECPL